MPPGKPFAKPTDAQRAAYGAQFKRDLVDLAGAALLPAAENLVKHVDATRTTNLASAALHHPVVKAGIASFVNMGIQLKARLDAEAEEAARVASDPTIKVEEKK